MSNLGGKERINETETAEGFLMAVSEDSLPDSDSPCSKD
jgi:hypothetical protein